MNVQSLIDAAGVIPALSEGWGRGPSFDNLEQGMIQPFSRDTRDESPPPLCALCGDDNQLEEGLFLPLPRFSCMFPRTTKLQISAGGIAYRTRDGRIEVALVQEPIKGRWQLPKGIVGKEETPERAALREVREETGLETDFVMPVDRIEYWYFSKGKHRIRFHKFVHFFLLRYRSGNTEDHDDEVMEARWIPLEEAKEMLEFRTERKVLEDAERLMTKEDLK